MVKGLTLKKDLPPVKRYYHDNMPKISIPTHTATLEYTKHALEQAKEEQYGEIKDLPLTLDLNRANLIEVDMRGNRVIKYLYNYDYNDKFQLTLALEPLGCKLYRVITVWLNLLGHNDAILKGKLNRSRYAIPEIAFIINQETKELISK